MDNIDKELEIKDNKAYKFMIGLVYPAVLGSILYNVLDKFCWNTTTTDFIKYFILLLILLVYTFDYLYTTSPTIEKNYNWIQVIFDIAIVICLYSSTNIILTTPINTDFWLNLSMLLALSKFINIIWEFYNKNQDTFALLLYCAFSILFILCTLGQDYISHWLIFVLIIDIIITVNYDKLSTFCE